VTDSHDDHVTVPKREEVDKPASLDALAFVAEKMAAMLADYTQKRNFSRLVVNVTKVGSIIAGAVLTIVIGSKPLFKDEHMSSVLVIVALVISTGLTALATWEAFSDHRWKWVRYRASISTLYRLQDDLCYMQKKDAPISVVQLDAFYELLKQAIHETNEEWMSKRSPNIGGSAGPSPVAHRPEKIEAKVAR
jgi:Protein of unknown function (DUF4231)